MCGVPSFFVYFLRKQWQNYIYIVLVEYTEKIE